MTAKTEAGALALEAALGDARRAAIWRAGAEAMREHLARSFDQSSGRLWRVQAVVIRNTEIPEMTDER